MSMDLNKYENESVTNTISAVTRTTETYHMPHWHWHPHYEMLIIHSGNYTLSSNGETICSDSPGIYINRPYTLHSANTGPGQPYTRSVVGFSRYVAAQLAQEMNMSIFFEANLVCAYPTQAELIEIKEMTDKLCAYIHDRTLCDPIMSRLYLTLILRKVMLIHADGRGRSVSCSVSYIQDALQFVSDNLSEPQTVESLAARYEVGQSKFYADFKSATGSTYKKYLTDLRQTRARELLSDGASIINASLECGYSSEAHFVKAFRDYWGITPGEYQRKLNQN